MLQLGSDTFVVDGVTVFKDNADPHQFWYLPAPVDIARQADGDAIFTLISWKPADASDGTKGGGFLTVQSTLKIPSSTEQSIRAQCASIAPSGTIKLTPAPWDSGTVRCIALDLQGSGGTSAPDDPPGTFRAVQTINGAAQPSLAGDNVAAFSLTLTQEGAIILKQAFEQGTTPVGFIYDLKYTGLRPALHVEIKADYEKIFQHFSASLQAQVYWVKAGIDAGFEELVANGVITIKVINYSTAADKDDKEKWALDFFKNDLLSKWFEPSLTPADMESRMAKAEGLDSVLGRAKTLENIASAITGTTPAGPGTTASGGPATTASNAGTTPQRPAATTQAAGGAAVAAPTPAAQRQAAALTVTSRSPDPSPQGEDLSMTPSASGTEELVTVSGGQGAWTATVGGQPAQLRDGKIVVDVPAGQSKDLVVKWPAVPGAARQETFKLFFTYERPKDPALEGRGSWNRSHPDCKAYASDQMTPRDDRFMDASRSDVVGQPPSTAVPGGGAAKLGAWLDKLTSPKILTVEGHASYEGHVEKATYNSQLSSRRTDVALEIIGTKATVPANQLRSLGQSRAQAAGRVSHPQGGGQDFPEDRVVEITAQVQGDGGRSEVTINAKVSRAADVVPTTTPAPATTPAPTTSGGPATTPKPAVTTTGGPATTPKPATTSPPSGGGGGMPAVVSFQMKYIRQEERKQVTLIYDRTDAVQLSYSPQGFIGLMLRDLAHPEKHFVDVDLDDPFFRHYEVVVDAPIDYARIGLLSAQASIDYGDPADPVTMKHRDFIFDRNSPTRQSFTTFMSPDLSTSYQLGIQFQFDPNSGWEGETLLYDFPAVPVVDRTQTLMPQQKLGFISVDVTPNRMDGAVLDFTEVSLTYTDPSGWQARKTLTVRPDGATQTWKVRSSDPNAVEYGFQFHHHLKDGRVIDEDPRTSTASAIMVNDPFNDALSIELIPLWAPGQIRTAFVEVSYSDPANNYSRHDRVVFEGDAADRQTVRYALLNPQLRSFTFQVTLIGSDNSIIRKPAQTVSDPIVAVAP